MHEDRPGLPANLRVEGRFEAAQAGVVDAHPAEEMRRELLVRVKTLALFREADAVEIQLRDPPRLIRRDLAPHVRELFALRELVGQRFALAPIAVSERVRQFPRGGRG